MPTAAEAPGNMFSQAQIMYTALMKSAAASFIALCLAIPSPLVAGAPPVAAGEGPPAVEATADQAEHEDISGSWAGAKLRCRKEEGKAVRCGKPEAFNVVFHPDGTGESADEKFPRAFSYRWASPTEIVVTPDDGGDDLKLFQLTMDEGFLTFQAYIYLPTENPDLPAEVNYIHYIFDVSRAD